jgi:hypothetical protein
MQSDRFPSHDTSSTRQQIPFYTAKCFMYLGKQAVGYLAFVLFFHELLAITRACAYAAR